MNAERSAESSIFTTDTDSVEVMDVVSGQGGRERSSGNLPSLCF